jgi:hypothetical protein
MTGNLIDRMTLTVADGRWGRYALGDKTMENNGLDLGQAVTRTGEEGSTTSSGTSSSTTSSERQKIHVKLDFGTKLFTADTECRYCEDLAEGVLVGKQSRDAVKEAVPICSDHYEEMNSKPRVNLGRHEYHTFETEKE